MEVAKPGMRLMCRLYWRQPGWYRAEELGQIAKQKKKEGDKEVMSSPDLCNMLSSLKEFGLIVQAGSDGEIIMQIKFRTFSFFVIVTHKNY